jgi:predicted Zn-dependent peptidase
MYNKTCLKNGVRIISERSEHLKSVSLGIWIGAGSRDENAASSGISHFIEHMVFKGTKRRSGIQIAKEFDAIGGLSNAFTGKEYTCYHARVLGSHFEACTDLLGDIVLNPIFDPADLERERQVVLQEISMVEDTPDDMIHELLSRSFWPGHPLGLSVLGSDETVSAIDRDGMLRHMGHAYVPGTILVTAAGNVNHDELVARFSPLFESLHPGQCLPPRSNPEPHGAVSCYEKDLEQVHICIGGCAPSQKNDNRFACSIFNTILGGNMSSRLFQEIRENRGLAYSVFSFVASYQDAGLVGVYAATDPGQVNDLLCTLKAEIRKLCDGELSRADLDAAREYLIGSMHLSAESPDHLMSRLAKNEFLFGHPVTCDEVESRLRKVGIDDVVQAASDAFLWHPVSLVTLGPFTDRELDGDNLVFGR